MMEDVKFVLVMRTDLNMRKGKMLSQAIHAGTAFLKGHFHHDGYCNQQPLSQVQNTWKEQGSTVIVVRADSEQELLDLHGKAVYAGIGAYLIRDAGKTEFHGVPTLTCLGIGPDRVDKINPITGHLRLL